MIAVTISTIIAIDGVFKLENRTDINFLIPESSHLTEFNSKLNEYNFDDGSESGVYMGQLNYTEKLSNIILFSAELQKRTDLIQNYSSWVEPFTQFVAEYYETSKVFHYN